MSRHLSLVKESLPPVHRSAELVHDLLSRIVDSVEEGIMASDLAGTITAWNRGAERIYGYPAAEIVGRHVSVLAPPDRTDESMALIQRISLGESVESRETIRAARDGHLIECWMSVSPIRDGTGEVIGVCAIVRDLTEHKQLSRKLLERDTQFNSLLEQLIAGVFILSAEGEILYINAGFMRLFGYGAADVIGHSMTEFVASADRLRVGAALRATLAGPVSAIEARVVARDGSLRTVLGQATGVPYEGRPALLGVVIDITDHKQTELALQRANRLLRTIGAGNVALVRAETEAALMQSMCDVLVTVGETRAAVIALCAPDGALHIAASAGARPEWVGVLRSWWDVAGRDDGPARVIRGGEAHFDRARACAWLPLKDHAETFGCLGLHVAEADPLEDESTLLTELADDLAYGIVALRHRADREASAARLTRAMEETVAALAATLEMRDPYTAGHQRHVAELAAAIARELGLDDSRIRAIHLAAIVHDIGKIKIPTELLTRPGALTSLEEQLLQTHAEAGYDILKAIDFQWPIADVVRQHHERLDGSGYPHGLQGSDILLESRVLAVADVIEAMSSDRPYRFGKGMEAALAVIEADRGVRYDAAVVDACLTLFREKGFTFSRPPVTHADNGRMDPPAVPPSVGE